MEKVEPKIGIQKLNRSICYPFLFFSSSKINQIAVSFYRCERKTIEKDNRFPDIST